MAEPIYRKCEICPNTFILGSYDKKRFCSTSCSNKDRVHNEESKQKTRETMKRWHDSLTPEQLLIRSKNLSSPESRAKFRKTMEIKFAEKIANTPWLSLNWDSQRRVVIQEQNGKCDSCNLSEWLGLPIMIEVDHINSDHSDHRRENLRGLCPNCHAQTDGWRGRNNKGGRRSLDRTEDLPVISRVL